jgi:hypothetical protein
MARILKPAREIENLLLNEVSQERECETVSSISIYVYPEKATAPTGRRRASITAAPAN